MILGDGKKRIQTGTNKRRLDMSVCQMYQLIKSNQKRIKVYENLILKSNRQELIENYQQKIDKLLKENEKLVNFL